MKHFKYSHKDEARPYAVGVQFDDGTTVLTVDGKASRIMNAEELDKFTKLSEIIGVGIDWLEA